MNPWDKRAIEGFFYSPIVPTTTTIEKENLSHSSAGAPTPSSFSTSPLRITCLTSTFVEEEEESSLQSFSSGYPQGGRVARVAFGVSDGRVFGMENVCGEEQDSRSSCSTDTLAREKSIQKEELFLLLPGTAVEDQEECNDIHHHSRNSTTNTAYDHQDLPRTREGEKQNESCLVSITGVTFVWGGLYTRGEPHHARAPRTRTSHCFLWCLSRGGTVACLVHWHQRKVMQYVSLCSLVPFSHATAALFPLSPHSSPVEECICYRNPATPPPPVYDARDGAHPPRLPRPLISSFSSSSSWFSSTVVCRSADRLSCWLVQPMPGTCRQTSSISSSMPPPSFPKMVPFVEEETHEEKEFEVKGGGAAVEVAGVHIQLLAVTPRYATSSLSSSSSSSLSSFVFSGFEGVTVTSSGLVTFMRASRCVTRWSFPPITPFGFHFEKKERHFSSFPPPLLPLDTHLGATRWMRERTPPESRNDTGSDWRKTQEDDASLAPLTSKGLSNLGALPAREEAQWAKSSSRHPISSIPLARYLPPAELIPLLTVELPLEVVGLVGVPPVPHSSTMERRKINWNAAPRESPNTEDTTDARGNDDIREKDDGGGYFTAYPTGGRALPECVAVLGMMKPEETKHSSPCIPTTRQKSRREWNTSPTREKERETTPKGLPDRTPEAKGSLSIAVLHAQTLQGLHWAPLSFPPGVDFSASFPLSSLFHLSAVRSNFCSPPPLPTSLVLPNMEETRKEEEEKGQRGQEHHAEYQRVERKDEKTKATRWLAEGEEEGMTPAAASSSLPSTTTTASLSATAALLLLLSEHAPTNEWSEEEEEENALPFDASAARSSSLVENGRRREERGHALPSRSTPLLPRSHEGGDDALTAKNEHRYSASTHHTRNDGRAGRGGGGVLLSVSLLSSVEEPCVMLVDMWAGNAILTPPSPPFPHLHALPAYPMPGDEIFSVKETKEESKTTAAGRRKWNTNPSVPSCRDDETRARAWRMAEGRFCVLIGSTLVRVRTITERRRTMSDGPSEMSLPMTKRNPKMEKTMKRDATCSYRAEGWETPSHGVDEILVELWGLPFSSGALFSPSPVPPDAPPHPPRNEFDPSPRLLFYPSALSTEVLASTAPRPPPARSGTGRHWTALQETTLAEEGREVHDTPPMTTPPERGRCEPHENEGVREKMTEPTAAVARTSSVAPNNGLSSAASLERTIPSMSSATPIPPLLSPLSSSHRKGGWWTCITEPTLPRLTASLGTCAFQNPPLQPPSHEVHSLEDYYRQEKEKEWERKVLRYIIGYRPLVWPSPREMIVPFPKKKHQQMWLNGSLAAKSSTDGKKKRSKTRFSTAIPSAIRECEEWWERKKRRSSPPEILGVDPLHSPPFLSLDAQEEHEKRHHLYQRLFHENREGDADTSVPEKESQDSTPSSSKGDHSSTDHTSHSTSSSSSLSSLPSFLSASLLHPSASPYFFSCLALPPDPIACVLPPSLQSYALHWHHLRGQLRHFGTFPAMHRRVLWRFVLGLLPLSCTASRFREQAWQPQHTKGLHPAVPGLLAAYLPHPHTNAAPPTISHSTEGDSNVPRPTTTHPVGGTEAGEGPLPPWLYARLQRILSLLLWSVPPNTLEHFSVLPAVVFPFLHVFTTTPSSSWKGVAVASTKFTEQGDGKSTKDGRFPSTAHPPFPSLTTTKKDKNHLVATPTESTTWEEEEAREDQNIVEVLQVLLLRNWGRDFLSLPAFMRCAPSSAVAVAPPAFPLSPTTTTPPVPERLPSSSPLPPPFCTSPASVKRVVQFIRELLQREDPMLLLHLDALGIPEEVWIWEVLTVFYVDSLSPSEWLQLMDHALLHVPLWMLVFHVAFLHSKREALAWCISTHHVREALGYSSAPPLLAGVAVAAPWNSEPAKPLLHMHRKEDRPPVPPTCPFLPFGSRGQGKMEEREPTAPHLTGSRRRGEMGATWDRMNRAAQLRRLLHQKPITRGAPEEEEARKSAMLSSFPFVPVTFSISTVIEHTYGLLAHYQFPISPVPPVDQFPRGSPSAAASIAGSSMEQRTRSTTEMAWTKGRDRQDAKKHTPASPVSFHAWPSLPAVDSSVGAGWSSSASKEEGAMVGQVNAPPPLPALGVPASKAVERVTPSVSRWAAGHRYDDSDALHLPLHPYNAPPPSPRSSSPAGAFNEKQLPTTLQDKAPPLSSHGSPLMSSYPHPEATHTEAWKGGVIDPEPQTPPHHTNTDDLLWVKAPATPFFASSSTTPAVASAGVGRSTVHLPTTSSTTLPLGLPSSVEDHLIPCPASYTYFDPFFTMSYYRSMKHVCSAATPQCTEVKQKTMTRGVPFSPAVASTYHSGPREAPPPPFVTTGGMVPPENDPFSPLPLMEGSDPFLIAALQVINEKRRLHPEDLDLHHHNPHHLNPQSHPFYLLDEKVEGKRKGRGRGREGAVRLAKGETSFSV